MLQSETILKTQKVEQQPRTIRHHADAEEAAGHSQAFQRSVVQPPRVTERLLEGFCFSRKEQMTG